MTELAPAKILRIYRDLMTEIKFRTEAYGIFFRLAQNHLNEPTAFAHGEACLIQIRKTCELMAIGTLVAHNELPEVRTKVFMREWNAQLLFNMLGKVNEEAFPQAIQLDLPWRCGTATTEPGHLTRTEMMKIYADLGQMLHAGSLRFLLKNPQREINLTQANEWMTRIVRLLSRHVILLPNRGNVLLAAMSGPDGLPHCSIWAPQEDEDSGFRMVCTHVS